MLNSELDFIYFGQFYEANIKLPGGEGTAEFNHLQILHCLIKSIKCLRSFCVPGLVLVKVKETVNLNISA